MFIDVTWTSSTTGKKHHALIRESDVRCIHFDDMAVEFDRHGQTIVGRTTFAEIKRLTSQIVPVQGLNFDSRPALFLSLPNEAGRHKPEVATMAADGSLVMTRLDHIASDARWAHEIAEAWAERAAGEMFEEQARELLNTIRAAKNSSPYATAIDKALKSAETPAKRAAKPVDGSKPH